MHFSNVLDLAERYPPTKPLKKVNDFWTESSVQLNGISQKLRFLILITSVNLFHVYGLGIRLYE